MMKNDRRDFLKKTSLGVGALSGTSLFSFATAQKVRKPVVISTWRHGIPANEVAWKYLKADQSALDAVEAGVRVPESDPNVRSVGYGGLPDRDGNVTLDACIMDHKGNCGAVSFLQHIENPISVARKVMEVTPHIMLSGEGALRFALEQGFEKKDLLTEASKKSWEEWLKTSNYKPVMNVENHDTIGMLAIDANGNISGACTTSGLAYKMHGRVGDSPIIGAGLFVDNEVGGACATGLGEAVIKVAGSAMVVEQMRNGASPTEACRAIVERLCKKNQNLENLQVGFLAIDRFGNTGAYAVNQGFNYALYTEESGNKLIDSESRF